MGKEVTYKGKPQLALVIREWKEETSLRNIVKERIAW